MTIRRIVTTESPAMKRIVAALEELGPMTAKQIAAAAHITRDTFVAEYGRILLRAGKIHHSGWARNDGDYGRWVPVYSAGPAKKAAPPRPKFCPLEKARRWKERSGYYEACKAERRLRRPPDPALRALMGVSA